MSGRAEQPLTAILPTPMSTAMLRACLLDGATARAAWDTWTDRFGGPRAVLAGGRDGVKRLLPMLEEAASRCDPVVEPVVRTCLRSARARETVRSRTFRTICGTGLAALTESGVPFTALRGVVLAELEYPDPALRHCHDCDLLVRPGAMDAAADALATAGFEPRLDETRAGIRRRVVAHASGLPIQLHERLLMLPHYDSPDAAVAERAEARAVCGVDARAPAPDDMLLHILAHASMAASRRHLTWVADAYLVMQSHPHLDWNRLIETAGLAGVELPLSVTLDWLAEALDAPVPAPMRAAVRESAARASWRQREAALVGAAAGEEGTARRLLGAAATWRDRASIVKWALLPSPETVRWAYHANTPTQVAFFYPLRPLRGLWRRLLGRKPRGSAPLPEFLVGDESTVAPTRPTATTPLTADG